MRLTRTSPSIERGMATMAEIVEGVLRPVNAWGGVGAPHGIRSSAPSSSAARLNASGQEATIGALAGTRSPRSLATNLGVSYEAIRTAVRERAVVCMSSHRA